MSRYAGWAVQEAIHKRLTSDETLTDLVSGVYFVPDSDVKRGDELRDSSDTYRVLFTVRPSRNAYLKASCERREKEGD